VKEQIGFNAARKRYHRIFWPAMIAYVAIVLGGAWLVNKDETPQWIAGIVAVATALPVCVALWAIVRWMSETDEYTRLKHLKGFARGAAITISGVFVIGFLQLFEVIDNFEVFWVGPAFFLAYGLSTCLPDLFGKTV
jgi:hydrogenase/urease accessory protein HupE